MPEVIFLAITVSWCGSCGDFKRDYGAHQEVRLVDAEARPDVAKLYGVKKYPTIVALVDGREVARTVGYAGRPQFERWMDGVKKLE